MELSLTSIKSSSIPLRYRLAGMGHLIGIGAIMRGSGFAFRPVWIAGALGDWLSYWVGRSIAEMWPFSRHPDLLYRGEAFIKKWGALAILIGRFSGPLRASVPVVAGVLGMPYRTFQLANFSSAFVRMAVLLELGDVAAAISTWCGTMSWAGSRRELVTVRRAPATPLTSAVCRIIRERKLGGRGNCSGSMCKAVYGL
jgi:membrane protein DedA with SNARE-associated domain